MGPKFDMLIKLKEGEDLEFIEELTDHAPPKSIKPKKSTMSLCVFHYLFKYVIVDSSWIQGVDTI